MQLRYLIYPTFLIVCLAIFWHTRNYGFATDYLGWLNNYRSGTWADVFRCFGYPGLHQFFHFINFSIYKLLGPNILALGTLFIVAHATVSYLVYRTFRLILMVVDEEKAGLVALFAGVLTALSPYCVEPLTWDACFHYFLCTGLIFLSLNCLIRYFRFEKKYFLYIHFLAWVLALFTIELALVGPGLFVVYGSFYLYHSEKTRSNIKTMGILTAIYLLILVAYFIGTKMAIGSFVGHYGAEQHLNFDPLLLSSTWCKYFFKLGFLSHFWAFRWKEEVYLLLDNWYASFLFIAMVMFLFWRLALSGRKSSKFQVPMLALLAFSVAILPVLNLFFVYVVPFENDRYTYFAAPHFYLMVVSLIFCIAKDFYWLPYFVFITVNAVFLNKNNGVARQAGNVTSGLMQSFNFYEEEEIVLLCIPENLNGAYLFRDYSETGITLNESLDWLGKGPYKGKLTNIAQYNLTSDRDSVTVEIVDSTKLKVNIASWGTWFWRKGQGMGNWDNEDFKITMGDMYFILEEKRKVKNRLYVYSVGDTWKSIKLP